MPTMPRRRFGWTGTTPTTYGKTYEECGVVPGDRVEADAYGPGTVVTYDDPGLMKTWWYSLASPTPRFDDEYVYVRLDTGEYDGFRPVGITKL